MYRRLALKRTKGLPWESSGWDFVFQYRGAGSIPDQETEILHVLWPKSRNIKQKQYCNKFNKDFKNGPQQKKKKSWKKKNNRDLAEIWEGLLLGSALMAW